MTTVLRRRRAGRGRHGHRAAWGGSRERGGRETRERARQAEGADDREGPEVTGSPGHAGLDPRLCPPLASELGRITSGEEGRA